MENPEYTPNLEDAQSMLKILRLAAEEMADSTELNWEAFEENPPLTEAVHQRTQFLKERAEFEFLRWNHLTIQEREMCVESLLYCYSIISLFERRNKIESMLLSL